MDGPHPPPGGHMGWGGSQSLRGLHLPRAVLLSPPWNLSISTASWDILRSCHHVHGPQGQKNSPSQEPPSPAPQAGTIPQHLEATSAGTWRDLEMWLASVGAHLHPLVASTCYQPGEALEKAKLHLLMRKRLWSYLALFLPLPEGQGPHHALQLYLEGTPLPWWLLSLPGSA